MYAALIGSALLFLILTLFRLLRKEDPYERLERLMRLFHRIAKERNGFAGTFPRGRKPTVCFAHMEGWVCIDLRTPLFLEMWRQWRKPGAESLRVSLMTPRWCVGRHRLQILDRRWDAFLDEHDMHDLPFVLPSPDARLVVRVDDVEFGRAFLRGAVGGALAKLARLGKDGVDLSLEGNVLRFLLPWIPGRYRQLRRLLDLALLLYDRVEEVRLGENVQVSGEAPESAVCPVCMAVVERDAWVSCARCRVPLHKECWKYAGGCPAYGCGASKLSATP